MKMLFILFAFSSHVFGSEELALKKIQQFGKTLQKELKKGLKESPVKAIEICNVKAPEIQKQVSTSNLHIGRVSLKNRNLQNTPKLWMESYIKQFHENKIKDAYVTVELGNGKKGLLKPIKMMPLCLKCHGSNIDESLYQVIKSKYPNDKAIGYKVGEIRGFFWVEY